MSETNIRVGLPLPLDVAGTVMKLIGAAYPGAMIRTEHDAMVFNIPEAERPKTVSKRAGKPMDRLEDDADLVGTADGLALSVPAFASVCLEVCKQVFGDWPDAENYLEQTVFDPDDGKKYVLTFRHGTGKTPHQLRETAEAELADAKAEIARLQKKLNGARVRGDDLQAQVGSQAVRLRAAEQKLGSAMLGGAEAEGEM